MENETALTIKNVSKTYGDQKVLDHISLTVPKGSVFGLLGPNGSGKTTLLGIILHVIKPDAGTYQWHCGGNSNSAINSLGALIETPNFYPYLTGAQNLKIVTEIKGSDGTDIPAVLKQVGLGEKGDKPFSSYSLGMKQRLAIAGCLVANLDIIIFDEPTNGLDPWGIADVRALILTLKEQGKTVIVSSHLLDEIERVCTHVAILNSGKLIAAGTVESVFKTPHIVEAGSRDMVLLYAALKGFPGAVDVIKGDAVVKLYFDGDEMQAEKVFQYCAEKGIYLNHLRAFKKDMETSFFELSNFNTHENYA